MEKLTMCVIRLKGKSGDGDEKTFFVNAKALLTRTSLFRNSPNLIKSGYTVQSKTTERTLSDFLNHIQGKLEIQVTNENCFDLKNLAREFGFTDLEPKLKAKEPHLRGALSVQSMMLRHQYFDTKGILGGKEIDSATHLTTSVSTPFSDYQDRLQELLAVTPNQSIAIPPIPRSQHTNHTGVTRRRFKTKYLYEAPLFFTCWKAVNNFYVKHFITLLILVNLGISIYMASVDESLHPNSFQALRNIEMSLNVIFLVEIVLHIIARGKWFFLDLYFFVDLITVIITFISPGFVVLVCADRVSDIQMVKEHTKWMWIVGALKCFRIIPRISAIRSIVKGFSSVLLQFFLLGVMIIMFMYVFAVFGVIAFFDYTKSDRPDLVYQHKFSSLGQAMLTVFQIFTCDSWLNIARDIAKVVNPSIALIYVMSWVWLGAYMFSNIFIAILVNNLKEVSRRQAKLQEHARRVRSKVKEREEYLARARRQTSKKKRRVKFDGELQIAGRDLSNRIRHIFSGFESFISPAGGDSGKAEIIAKLNKMGHDFETTWTHSEINEYFELLVDIADTLAFDAELDRLMSQAVLRSIECPQDTTWRLS